MARNEEPVDDWDAETDEEQDNKPEATPAPQTVVASQTKRQSNGHTAGAVSADATPNLDDNANTSDTANESDDSANTSDDVQEDADGNPGDSTSSEPRVLDAYRHLLSRRVDLVGDYAGTELFLIDGDSLLLRAFQDEHLDFDNGFQLLHATYNVEHFLSALITRKCHFHIVFADSNRHLCVPPTAEPSNVVKFQFARSAIIRHLQVNLQHSHPDVQVTTFPSLKDASFKKYLDKTAPYFVMLHDGASAASRKGKHIGHSAEQGPSAARIQLRSNILHFRKIGYNVALLNGLEWRDTKVMAMVLEISKSVKLKASSLLPAPGPQAEPSLNVDASISKIQKAQADLTEREQLAVLAVASVLQEASPDAPKSSLATLSCLFLVHEALLAHLPLLNRRVPDSSAPKEVQSYFQAIFKSADTILNATSWRKLHQGPRTDVADFIDGRLFYHISKARPELSGEVDASLQKMLKALNAVMGDPVDFTLPSAKVEEPSQPAGNSAKADLAVLPFSNPVFDKHLEIVHLKIDEDLDAPAPPVADKIFRELTHWHNVKRPISTKTVAAPTARDKFFADRRFKHLMSEMRTYAASLTNAVGKSLEPETIIEGSSKTKASTSTLKAAASPADSDASDAGSNKSKGKGGKPGGGKNAAKSAVKEAMLKQIAADRAKKDEAAGGKIASSWQTVCKGFDVDSNPRSRFQRAKNHFAGLQSASLDVVGAEIQLYMMNEVIRFWIERCKDKDQQNHVEALALIWNFARDIAQSKELTKTIVSCLDLTTSTLKLPPLPSVTDTSLPDRKLAFTFALPTKSAIVANALSPKQFQLEYAGPYLERSFDSAEDDRVDFKPDGWQRKVLDTLDRDQSAFVVAPTSAGKTFISFYAMRKVLERDSEGVIVYVAPTKALVNQIAAEIQARYSKTYKYGGKSVWGIHTRDYRINNPTGCQVLVTVPHILQIMLLAPSHANTWSSRIKRIIFDEVHSIGQAEDGVVWEQLLLLAPCPIIALSATVGNPEAFSSWLSSTQKAIGQDLVTVQHPHRYSDLRKYFFTPPKEFAFGGLPDRTAFGTLSMDGVQNFNFVHPVAGLIDKSRGIPEDLALEPRDCYLLWSAMTKHQTKNFSVPATLDPKTALPEVARKADILAWELGLKQLLKQWIADAASPYDAIVEELGRTFRDASREQLQVTRPGSETLKTKVTENLEKSTLPMLCRLHAQDALPAILFNFDRGQCEKICQELLHQLQHAEKTQVKSGKKWERTLEQWEEWKKVQAKAASKKGKVASKKGGNKDDEKESKLDQQKDAGLQESSQWESFDPNAPQPGYHFADHSKALISELDIYTRQLVHRGVPQYLVDALGRGIGVHHAGMNRKYRQVVEILFRKRFLRVVIATGTLALGINMPAKTVVFSGDSVFLTALNYRQCAGRAGRRGFDLLGNVIFQGISREKVCRLMSSRLPDLNGHFPITTTLVLRLFTLLHDSKQSKYAVSAINALLSQPRLYLGGPSFKEATMHHLRFSIEYLRRQHLLDSRGASLNFAGLVSHLYFTESSSFAFHALIKGGYFHNLCANINRNEKQTLETLMLVMAHIFGRVYCRKADEEYKETVVKPSSSIVFLPPMPEEAAKVLREHNKETLNTFTTYVETFVDQHLHDKDDKLPLTGLNVGGNHEATISNSVRSTKIRSPFVALSGKDDHFATIHDLCSTTRAGVFLEEAVIPYIPVYPEEGDEFPLNAWLLDFFKHGDIHALEKGNGIRTSDIWFMLNDFSLVLATIITSLQNFMHLAEGTDLDMLDVMGDFDTHEEENEDKVAADETGSEVSGPSVADSGVVMDDQPTKRPQIVSKKSGKKAESWEDVEDSQAAADRRAVKLQEVVASQEQADRVAAAAGLKDEGLKDVLLAFQKLRAELMVKFKAMWA